MPTCVIVLLGLAGCALPVSLASPPAPSDTACVPPPAAAPPAEPGASPGGAPVAPASSEVALQLEALLSKHAMLAVDLMRGRLRNDEDFAQAANSAVGQNTADLARTFGMLCGEPTAARFQGLWTDHVTALFTYSRGLATNDAAVRDEARNQLAGFSDATADFFATASQGRLDAATARREFSTHVDHLTQQADLYAAGDYARANEIYRGAYRHSFELGYTLADGLLPPEQAAQLDTQEWKLRSEMTRLLGEHVGLALGALRAGATNAPDFPAAVETLNGNTTDLTAAVGSLFGEQAASQFMTLWADHIDILGGYAADVGAGEENRREAAQDELRDWQQRFASFIATATGGRLAANDLSARLLALDEVLMRQVDALAVGDFQQAVQLADQVYPAVFQLARNMADAFGATLAEKMPQGGAGTGGGGMAGELVAPPVVAPGIQPAAPPVAQPVTPPAAHPVSPPAAQQFRSVRTYQEVAVPVRLRIPAVGIDTPLQRLGRAADRTVQVPGDADVAGWFAGGPRPGQAGPAVILGHVDSQHGPGVFFPLAGLATGTDVHVDRADGSTASFRVTSVVEVPKTGFPTDHVYGPTLRSSLRLVTCGGPFDQAAGSYQDNVIVAADPVR